MLSEAIGLEMVEQGMLRFLRNLFGRAQDAPLSVAAPVATGLPSPPPPFAEPHPFDAVWELLSGEDIPLPPRLSVEEYSQVTALVPMVLGHYAEHRPAPASFPALAMQILEMTRDPDLEMNELLRTISMDPAISMHILRVANSALYRREQEIQDLRRAVLHLGIREVGDIASAVATRSLFDSHLQAEFQVFTPRWNRMFLDTMAVAFGASAFAFEQSTGRAEHAFLSGMFHDIGKSIALRSLAALIHEGHAEQPISDAVVDEVLERVHVEVGGDLHLVWGLPEYLTRICLRHHEFEIPTGLEFMDIHILRLAEGFHSLQLDPKETRYMHETRQSLQALNLSYRSALRLYVDMQAQAERVQLLFGG